MEGGRRAGMIIFLGMNCPSFHTSMGTGRAQQGYIPHSHTVVGRKKERDSKNVFLMYQIRLLDKICPLLKKRRPYSFCNRIMDNCYGTKKQSSCDKVSFVLSSEKWIRRNFVKDKGIGCGTNTSKLWQDYLLIRESIRIRVL
jgi:hypothetical protein